MAGGRPRFLGLRIVYDPRQITGPGTYEVDPAAEGGLELYCLRPTEPPGSLRLEMVAYEVSAATIAIDSLPGSGRSWFRGSFRNVTLERMDLPILGLTHGVFRAQID